MCGVLYAAFPPELLRLAESPPASFPLRSVRSTARLRLRPPHPTWQADAGKGSIPDERTIRRRPAAAVRSPKRVAASRDVIDNRGPVVPQARCSRPGDADAPAACPAETIAPTHGPSRRWYEIRNIRRDVRRRG